ncbi:hypothetical protein J3E69DRAFT_139587 [Trichoderma sp. SZMC 28015]
MAIFHFLAITNYLIFSQRHRRARNTSVSPNQSPQPSHPSLDQETAASRESVPTFKRDNPKDDMTEESMLKDGALKDRGSGIDNFGDDDLEMLSLETMTRLETIIPERIIPESTIPKTTKLLKMTVILSRRCYRHIKKQPQPQKILLTQIIPVTAPHVFVYLTKAAAAGITHYGRRIAALCKH